MNEDIRGVFIGNSLKNMRRLKEIGRMAILGGRNMWRWAALTSSTIELTTKPLSSFWSLTQGRK